MTILAAIVARFVKALILMVASQRDARFQDMGIPYLGSFYPYSFDTDTDTGLDLSFFFFFMPFRIYHGRAITMGVLIAEKKNPCTEYELSCFVFKLLTALYTPQTTHFYIESQLPKSR